jgi:hypothetical protein
MFHSGPQTVLGEQNVPGAGGNLLGMAINNPYGNVAGIQLPLPGQLNRGGAFRQPGYRPGGGIEEIPVRPMLPSDYQGQPAFPTQGVPLAFNGSVPMGNAGVDAKALANFQALLDRDMESRYQNPSIKESRVPDGFVRSGLY